MKYSHPIKAVVFDVDGTILETIKVYYEANKLTSGDPDFPFSFQERLNGMCAKDVAAQIIEYYHLDMTPLEYIEKRSEFVKSLFSLCTLVPGIERIIYKLHEMQIPMALGTSARKADHNQKIQKYKDIFSLFNATVTGDDVQNGKPAPDIFLYASHLLGNFSPENVLVFEDAFPGVMAANAAGMPCVLHSDDNPALIQGLVDNQCQTVVTLHHYNEFDFGAFVWEPPTI